MRSSARDARPAARLPALVDDPGDVPGDVLGALAGEPVVIVDLSTGDQTMAALAPGRPCIVIGIDRAPVRHPPPPALDVALTSSPVPGHVGGWVPVADAARAADRLASRIATWPKAAVICCQVLRATETMDVAGALLVESLAYSALQSGPEFSEWLATATRPSPKPDLAATVLVERDGNVLTLTLNRRAARNALNARMRDELVEALSIARHDPSVEEVRLRGAGAAFSSGGDLSEFGTFQDPATAHLVRTVRSPARLLGELAQRASAHLHGPCVGAGVELAAFCKTVAATPDTTFSLPELGLGLIPGAGGTVSIPRRIGRHRSAWLALSGETLDALTALDWGLVDVLEEAARRGT